MGSRLRMPQRQVRKAMPFLATRSDGLVGIYFTEWIKSINRKDKNSCKPFAHLFFNHHFVKILYIFWQLQISKRLARKERAQTVEQLFKQPGKNQSCIQATGEPLCSQLIVVTCKKSTALPAWLGTSLEESCGKCVAPHADSCGFRFNISPS